MHQRESFITDEDRQAIRQHFDEHVTGPVTIELFSQPPSLLTVPGRDCPSCQETEQLLTEVAELSDHITLNIHDTRTERDAAEALGITHIPAFLITGQAKGNVRYLGLPSGYEFMNLMEDMGAVSSGATQLSDKARTALRDLTRDVHIQVFVTPT